MPLADVVQAALSRPMARVLESPVRELMDRILQDHGYASPDQVRVLTRQLQAAEDRLLVQEERIQTLEDRAAGMQAQLES